MTFQNRAAAARLIRIERALRNAENRLDAAIHRQDTRGEVSDVTPLHNQIRALVGEATDLHPASDAGLASKARIVVRNYNLASVGRSILYSLVEDLQVRERRRS